MTLAAEASGQNDHVPERQVSLIGKLKREDLHDAAQQLRKISTLTEGLPADSLVDARLRDRLGLAADVLDAVAGVDQEHPE
jgi:hypothetical protein